jgi:hypothetical protein
MVIADEDAHSHSYGGRSVFGWEPDAAHTTKREDSAS